MHTKSKSRTTTTDRLLPLITPGEFLAEEFLEPMNLSSNALAIALQVPANRIQAIVKGQRSISADTALRLARYFGTSAEFWMNLQQAYDLDSIGRQKGEEIRTRVPERKAS